VPPSSEQLYLPSVIDVVCLVWRIPKCHRLRRRKKQVSVEGAGELNSVGVGSGQGEAIEQRRVPLMMKQMGAFALLTNSMDGDHLRH